MHVLVAARTLPAQQHYAKLLSDWVGDAPPAGDPLTPEERETFETMMAAFKRHDTEALEQWGGRIEASRIATALHHRDIAATAGAAGRIDGFSTHLAARLSEAFLPTVAMS